MNMTRKVTVNIIKKLYSNYLKLSSSSAYIVQEQATNLTVPPGRRKQFRCAFFNFTGGANGTGGWSYSGVQTEVINETHVRCNAAHLTSFVVLVSIVPAADIVSAIIAERVYIV